jgi:pantoate--beta-alanine ligase
MSSRNAYLSAGTADAVALPTAMRAAIAAIEGGADVAETLAAMQAIIAGGFISVDYAELRDADSLTPLTSRPAAPARLLVAARIGKARFDRQHGRASALTQ